MLVSESGPSGAYQVGIFFTAAGSDRVAFEELGVFPRAGQSAALSQITRVVHLAARASTGRSEGVVKTEISWAVREHRLRCQRRLRTKTLEISPESLCGGVVPPTIDSTEHSAMILLCEHPIATGCESAQSVPSV